MQREKYSIHRGNNNYEVLRNKSDRKYARPIKKTVILKDIKEEQNRLRG